MKRATSDTNDQSTFAVPLVLDRRRALPLHAQLVQQVKARIADRRLAPGVRLPSTRDAALLLGVSRTTVTTAYEQLLSEGYLESRRGAGTFVPASLPAVALVKTAAIASATTTPQVRLSDFVTRLGEWRPPSPARASTIDLTSREPDLRLFPLADWSRLLRQQMRQRPLGRPPSLDDIGGLAPLREAIASYLRYARGVTCAADQIVVVTGSQQALDLCARVLVNPGDQVALEEPGYPEARRLFGAVGARVRPVPVDAEGLIVRRLPPQVRLAMLTPSHQYPLGMALSLTRRLELLQWAQRPDRLIIENDYDSEFRYDGSPLPALQGLGDASRVIYLGTFSLAMFPALRIGYLVLPRPLVMPFLQAKWHTDRHTPHLEQGALAEFIRRGHLARHIRRMRRVYRRRRDVLLDSLHAHLGDRVSIADATSGLHVVVRFSSGRCADQARQRGVLLLSTASCYANPASAPAHEYLLRFSNVSERLLVEAVRRLSGVSRAPVADRQS